mmetsp:Transcript_3528/g.7728  ORF Transcript_3528/g.7728 Transcript_3528/m.7728 type:complete len:88 (-) Transcript_3528:98-361(-)
MSKRPWSFHKVQNLGVHCIGEKQGDHLGFEGNLYSSLGILINCDISASARSLLIVSAETAVLHLGKGQMKSVFPSAFPDKIHINAHC